MKFDPGFRAGARCMLGALVLASGACAARQVPPGPDPEYQRPEVVPWEEATAEDPLTNIEDEGEWVDEAPSGHGETPATPGQGGGEEPSPQPGPAGPPSEPSPPGPPSEPKSEPSPAPKPGPSPAPQTPQNP